MGCNYPDVSASDQKIQQIQTYSIRSCFDSHSVPLTVDGIIGTQCPSTYMASSIENGWEPSTISPLLCRLRLTF